MNEFWLEIDDKPLGLFKKYEEGELIGALNAFQLDSFEPILSWKRDPHSVPIWILNGYSAEPLRNGSRGFMNVAFRRGEWATGEGGLPLLKLWERLN